MSNISDDDLNMSAGDDRIVGSDRGDYQSVGAVRATGAAGVKAIFAPGNRKRLMIYAASGVVLLFALTKAFLSVDESDVPRGGAGSVEAQKVNTNINTKPSAIQREEAERYNGEVLAEEQKSDPSAHPVVVVDDEEGNPFVGEATFAKPKKVSEIGTTESQAPTATAQTRQAQAAPSDYSRMDDLIQQLVEAEGARVPESYAVEWKYNRKGSSAGAGGEAQTLAVAGKSDADAAANKCPIPVARAAEMYMATADIALNSDVGGPVALTIRSGKLRNAKLIGKFERKEEWMRMTFDKLVVAEDTVSVDAIGLDMDTTLNAVGGEVDNHYLYRYGWWGIGTAMKAIGAAAEANGDSNVTIAGDTVINTSKRDAARETKMAIGSLGKDIGEVFQDRINRPVTVTLKVNDQVGVFFLDDVCMTKEKF